MIGTDNLSAATHELRSSGGRALNQRFRDVLYHYGLESRRIRPGCANENGVAEKGHHQLQTALEQALLRRGNREFDSTQEYTSFVADVVAKLNAGVEEAFAAEQRHLAPLPTFRLPDYTVEHATVRKWSTIRVRGRTYSVPSRLIGHRVEARVYADVIEVRYGGQHTETMERLRGNKTARIDYRHVIWSLVRKPGAFAQYRFREELFPSLAFRRAYDALRDQHRERADIEYVRILHLAASTQESDIQRILVR